MSFDFDELQSHFKKLEKDAIDFETPTSVSYSELFTTSFMRKHTRFSSFDEFLSAGGFNVNSPEDFEAIPDDVFDNYISSCTNFSCFEDMLIEASSDYALKKIGL